MSGVPRRGSSGSNICLQAMRFIHRFAQLRSARGLRITLNSRKKGVMDLQLRFVFQRIPYQWLDLVSRFVVDIVKSQRAPEHSISKPNKCALYNYIGNLPRNSDSDDRSKSFLVVALCYLQLLWF